MKNIFFALLFLFSGCAASSSVNSMANQSIATFLAQARVLKPFTLSVGSRSGTTISNLQVFQSEYVVIGQLVIYLVSCQYNISAGSNPDLFIETPTVVRQRTNDLTFYPAQFIGNSNNGDLFGVAGPDNQTADLVPRSGTPFGTTVIFEGWILYQNGEGQLQS